jgi:hypothetical protein
MDSCIPKEEEEEEAYTKSTLKYLNIDNMEIRKAHMVWEAAGYETVSVSKAMIKVKLLLGTLSHKL